MEEKYIGESIAMDAMQGKYDAPDPYACDILNTLAAHLGYCAEFRKIEHHDQLEAKRLGELEAERRRELKESCPNHDKASKEFDEAEWLQCREAEIDRFMYANQEQKPRVTITVEKVENGHILKSGGKTIIVEGDNQNNLLQHIADLVEEVR